MPRVPLSELIYQGANPVRTAPGRSVSVYERGTTEEATIYAAETGEATVSQPLTTDAGGLPTKNGQQVWLEAGTNYDFKVAGQTVPVATGGLPDSVVSDSSAEAASPISKASGGRKRGLRDFVSVIDFGAVADYNGTTGTDNTTAFQNALNSGAKHVWVPFGEYLIGPLTIPDSVSLVGAGQFGTKLFAKAGTTTPLISLASTKAQFVTIEGLTLIGVGNTSGATGQHGIYLQGVPAPEYPHHPFAPSNIPDAHITVRDVDIMFMGGVGLFPDTEIRSSLFDNVWVDSPGLSCFNCFGANNNYTNCIASGAGNTAGVAGFLVEGPNSRMVGCIAFFNGTQGAGTTDGFRILSERQELVGCESEENGRFGFDFASNRITAVGINAGANGIGGIAIVGKENVIEGFESYSRVGGRYTQGEGVFINGIAEKCVISGVSVGNTNDVNGPFKSHSVRIMTSAGLTTNQVSAQASTPVAGTELVNATPTILSYAAPNDGKLHTVNLYGAIIVTGVCTGGIISMKWTLGGIEHTTQIDGGGHSVATFVLPTGTAIIDPGTTLSVVQTSALTGGAAKVFAVLASAAD